jgi:hypothetical protein
MTSALRDRRSPVALLALLAIGLPAAAGCRARRAPSSEGVGIGFSLDDNPLVERGAIVTQPGGREEAFLVFVAGGAPLWLDACRKESGGSPVIFSFKTDDNGRPQAAPQVAAAPARARCAAAQAAVATAATPLPPGTEVTVQVTLKSSN